MIESKELDWKKGDGLLPAIIQDFNSKNILMLGYMNAESFDKTLETKKVTFFSRSKQSLWVKGETSGNFLNFISAEIDCDQDTILIQALPEGPVCHTGAQNCFNNDEPDNIYFLKDLSEIITSRKQDMPKDSYIASLFQSGTKRIAQKVGEEGVELALAATVNDKEEILNEAADLIFHILVLLEDRNISLNNVCDILKKRQAKK